MFVKENLIAKENNVLFMREIDHIVPQILLYECEKTGIYDLLPDNEKLKFQVRKSKVMDFCLNNKIIIRTGKTTYFEDLQDLIGFRQLQRRLG